MHMHRSCCRFTPILRGVREEIEGGAYTLVLEFETKKDMTMEMWTDRLDKIESFFGPGIKAKVISASWQARYGSRHCLAASTLLQEGRGRGQSMPGIDQPA